MIETLGFFGGKKFSEFCRMESVVDQDVSVEFSVVLDRFSISIQIY
jgi:hypothetical protein